LGCRRATTSSALAEEDGKSHYAAGRFGPAQEAFQSEFSAHPRSPERAFNLGAAAYKNQKWAEAIDAFGKALQTRDKTLRSRAEYNFANTLVQQARQGRRGQDTTALQQAIDHYEESLRADPQFSDAQTNLEFVKKLLHQPPPPQDQKQKDSKDQNSDKNQNDPQEQSESDSNDKSDSKESGKGKKDGQKKDSSKGDNEEKNSDDPGKDPEKNPEKSDGSPEGDKEGKPSSNQSQPQGKEEQPPGEKERGELKNSPVDAPDKPKPEKEQEGQAGGSGKITREQARALLDALRSEDRRVNLWASENQKQAGKMREGKTW
jgi:Ca-activated chloride channel family protein